MRCLVNGMLMLAAAGCTASDEGARKIDTTVALTAVAFDGADYASEAAKTAHGQRIATLFQCSGCHGAALDGVGEPAGNIQGALAYDDAAFDRLLVESVDRTGRKVTMEFGFGHEAQQLSAAERRDVIAYVRAPAGSRNR